VRTDFSESTSFFIPARVTVATKDGDAIEREFLRHARKWRRDTKHLSSPVDRYLHPSYARIIAITAAAGQAGLRVMLTDLQEHQNDWFYALRSITGQNPVTSSMAGDVPRMIQAWIKWGQERGVIDGAAA
jgi:hypothetical protein